jgi:hypothetical protein
VNLHPKVAWPLLANAVLTVLAAVVAALAKGNQAALLTAVVGGAVTIVGLVTGYSVPSPGPVAVPTAAGGSISGP